MAKSSRRGKPVEVEEEELSQDEGGTAPNREEMFLMGLLIVAFGFILLGIVVNWYVLHDRYDTPLLGVIQKDPNDMVKAQVYKGKAPADEGEEVDEGDGGGEEDSGDGE